MAFLVLLSSTGVGLTEHQCLVSGKSVRSFFEDKGDTLKPISKSGCCAKTRVTASDGRTFFKKAECCREQQTFQKTEIVNTQLQSKSIKVGQQALIFKTSSLTFLWAYWQQLPSPLQGRNPNPFSFLFHGKAMLIFIQSFLI